MYGHNNIADGWAGAANTHPHPTPHPTPFPTETPAQKGSKTLVFPLFDSMITGRRTEKASHRVAFPQPKPDIEFIAR